MHNAESLLSGTLSDLWVYLFTKLRIVYLKINTKHTLLKDEEDTKAEGLTWLESEKVH